jgi:hypothetical protein
MRHFIFLFLLLAAACKHEPNPCDTPTKSLEEVLPGTWELTELKGWPHSHDEFVPVPNTWASNGLVIGEDGSYQHSNNPKTTYELKVRDNETFLCPSHDEYGWAITEYDNCTLVFRLDGSDEGPVYFKYLRQK